MTQQIKLAIFGNKTTTSTLIRFLYDHSFEVDTLISIDPSKMNKLGISGSDKNLQLLSRSLGFKIFHPCKYNLKEESDLEFFRKSNFDIGLCTGWQRLIPESVLQTFRLGVFGWHGSGFEFPNGRGRSPLNWSIRLGLGHIYHNCFRYASEADNGDIYETNKFSIASDDYISDVVKKAVLHIKSSSLRLLGDAKMNNIRLRKQLPHAAISFPKLSEGDGHLCPHSMSLRTAINITRSCSRPFPGAYVDSANASYRVWKLTFSRQKVIGLRPGDVGIFNGKLFIYFRDALAVSCDYSLIS